MGPRSSVDVFLTLHGQRKFAKELAASGAELEAMGVKGARSVATFAASGARLKKFGASWTRHVSLPIAALAAVSGKMALDFDRQMLLISTQAGGTHEEVEKLSHSILDLSSKGRFAQGPRELAEALFHIESVGIRGAKAMRTLTAASDLATVGNADLEATTNALVGAQRTGVKGTKNIRTEIGLLNSTIGAGNLRMEDLTAAMGTGFLVTAKQVGLSLGDAGAALAELTSQSVPATAAATRLRMTFNLMAAPSTKAQKALKGIGLNSESLAKEMRKPGGLVKALELLKDHLSGLTKIQQTQLLSEAFGGARSGTTIMALVGNLEDVRKKYKEIGENADNFNKKLKETNAEQSVRLEKAWARIQALLIKFGSDILPVVVPGLEKLALFAGKIAEGFKALPGPMQASIVGFLLLTGPIASGLGYFASGIGRAMVLTVKLAGAMKDLQIAGSALMAGQGLSSFSMAFQGSGMASAAMWVKGFMLALGPIAAAAGIANIVYSATKGDWKQTGFKAGGAITGGIIGFIVGGPFGAMLGIGIGSAVGGAIAKLKWSQIIGGDIGLNLAGPVGAVIGGMFGDKIAAGLLAAGDAIIDFYSNLPGRVVSGLEKLPSLILGVFKKIPRTIGFFLGLWASMPVRVALFVKDMVGRVLSLLGALAPHLLHLGSRAIDRFGEGARIAFHAVIDFYKSMPSRIVTALTWLPSKLLGIGQDGGDSIAKGVGEGGDGVLDWFKNLPSKLWSLLGQIGPDLLSFGGKIASEIASGFYDVLPSPLQDALGFAGIGPDESTGQLKDLRRKPRRPRGPHGPIGPTHRRGAHAPMPRMRRQRLDGGDGSLAGALHVAVENVNTLMLDGKVAAETVSRHAGRAEARS